jgi:hypothetical protein
VLVKAKQQYTAWSIFLLLKIAGAGDELQGIAESWQMQL